MKLAIGNKVVYHYPENSFPQSRNNGMTYTGIVTNTKHEVTHDRATVNIDTNPENLIQIECNQTFIDFA